MKPIRFIPLLTVICLIYVLTFQPSTGSVELSEGFRQFFMQLFKIDSAGNVPRWAVDGHWFRTLMHIPEYLLLGTAVAIAFDNKKLCMGICAAIGLLDELIKIWLPGREFDPVDLGFDIIGAAAGIAFVGIIVLIIHRSRRTVKH